MIRLPRWLEQSESDAPATDNRGIGKPLPQPPLWPSLLVCALAALWIDFSSIHQEHHADSLLPVLVSLYRWTPFYWELDRIGMLVPLIALPIKHPLANLLVQDAIYIFGSLTALVLVARYVLRDRTYPLVGMLSVAALVGLTPGYYRFHFLIDTQYGIWLSLGLGGLILLEPDAQGRIAPGRRIGAIVLLTLAHWCYCTTALFLGPLIVLRWLAFQRVTPRWPTRKDFVRGELVSSLVAMGVAFAIGLVLMSLSASKNTNFGTLPFGQWPPTLRALFRTTWHALSPQWWPLALVACGVVGMALSWPMRRRVSTATAWRGAAALVGAASFLAIFMATRQWVPANGHQIRFLYLPALFAQTALIGVAVCPWAGRLPKLAGRLASPLAAALVVLAIAVSLGRPSLARVRHELLKSEQANGPDGRPIDIHTADVLAARCTHIAGNYWRVWPAVFRANLALYERGQRPAVWGISLRSTPTRPLWSAVPRSQTRVAVFAGGDSEADNFLSYYGLLPLVPGERRPSIVVLEPGELAATDGSAKGALRR